MHEGKFTTQYSRTFVEAAQKIAKIPRLTPAQDEALDLLARVCDELAYEMELGPGDIQLLILWRLTEPLGTCLSK